MIAKIDSTHIRVSKGALERLKELSAASKMSIGEYLDAITQEINPPMPVESALESLRVSIIKKLDLLDKQLSILDRDLMMIYNDYAHVKRFLGPEYKEFLKKRKKADDEALAREEADES